MTLTFDPAAFDFAAAMVGHRADPFAKSFDRKALLAVIFCCGADPSERFDAAWAVDPEGSGPGLIRFYEHCLSRVGERITSAEFSRLVDGWEG